jgi:hypothetical protein
MKNLSLRLLFAVATLGLAIASGHAQDVPFTVPHSVPIPEALRAHGITDLSEGSLIAALKSSDPQARGMAALQLGEDGHSGAAQAIEAAFADEKDLSTKVNLAEALWELHDPRGVEHLHAMCTDPSMPFVGLISAVDALQYTSSPSGVCAENVLASMSREKDKDNGYLAMEASRLPRMYGDVPPELAGRIFEVLKNLLLDRQQISPVRQIAGQALAQIGIPESAKVIGTAISQEGDPVLRSSFVSDLNALERKK